MRWRRPVWHARLGAMVGQLSCPREVWLWPVATRTIEREITGPIPFVWKPKQYRAQELLCDDADLRAQNVHARPIQSNSSFVPVTRTHTRQAGTLTRVQSVSHQLERASLYRWRNPRPTEIVAFERWDPSMTGVILQMRSAHLAS
jgi:hypothetical protein